VLVVVVSGEGHSGCKKAGVVVPGAFGHCCGVCMNANTRLTYAQKQTQPLRRTKRDRKEGHYFNGLGTRKYFIFQPVGPSTEIYIFVDP